MNATAWGWFRAVCCTLGLSGGTGTASAACTISSPGVAFGVYVPANPGNHDVGGSVAITCSLDSGDLWQNYSFTASFSTGSSATYANRQMVRAGGTQPLNYNLYNSGFTQIYGNGSGGTATISGSIFVWFWDTSNTVTTPIAARIPPLQNAMPGSYLDTIMLTVNF